MSTLIVYLIVLGTCVGCFAYGVIVGRGWRVFDHIEARLLNKLESLRGVGDDQ